MDQGANTLQITEIFHSIQGESLKAGLPTVFIRLTGCPLRCTWCDTDYAFTGGRLLSMSDILAQVAAYAARHVTVTGGEPLAQKNCLALLTRLCDIGYQVSLETSGALSLADVDRRVVKVVDIKAPGSGEMQRNRADVRHYLQDTDQIKFVLCDRADYLWAKQTLREQDLLSYCEVLFAPVWDQLPARQLAEWILEDGLPVRLQLQLHKILWGQVPGR